VNSTLAAAWLILTIWAAMYVRKVLDPTFPVPSEMLPVVLPVVGYLFGRDWRDRLRGKDRGSND
jgi:uncharacterized membrane protein AbrB (regulator of aidB expression)